MPKVVCKARSGNLHLAFISAGVSTDWTGDWQAGIQFRKRAAELNVLVHFDQYPGQLYRGTNFRHKKLWDTHLFRSAALLEHSFHKIQAEFRAALEAGKLDPFLTPEGSTLKTRGEWNILHFYRVVPPNTFALVFS